MHRTIELLIVYDSSVLKLKYAYVIGQRFRSIIQAY